MAQNFSVIKECRLCKGGNIEVVLDFGLVPLANSYPKSQNLEEDCYPLTVMKCKDCHHVQLRETVEPDILFSNYSYASSDSPALVNHFGEFASTVIKKFNLEEENSLLEIGCNDGILLKQFAKLDLVNLYGVEPATNIAERAMGCGAVIINKFFSETTAKKILDNHGKMNVICANNVFAHVADIDSMILGISHLLSENGVFIFENAYLLDTIKGLYFDQVYHEHLQYYGIYPLTLYLAKFGFQIFDVEYVGTQGGSFRIYAQRARSHKWEVKPSVREALWNEAQFSLYANETYQTFQKKINELSNQVKGFIKKAMAEGQSISCYGCPAKFALFSKVFGLGQLNTNYVVDDSLLKQGCFSPGKKIPIVNRDCFVKKPTNFCLISVWNMAEAVMKKNPEYNGRWVIPMPNFKII